MTAARIDIQRFARERPKLVIEATSPIPTRHGELHFSVFRHSEDWTREHVAIVAGAPSGRDVLVRVHSECMTSEVFGSLKCDCAEQLDASLAAVAKAGRGVVVYLRQEGRSIGLANKIRAYALQAKGADTVDANRALDLPDDARRYDAAAAFLHHARVESVRLMTNNPAKVEALEALGIEVCERIPIVVQAHPLSHAYLATKRTRMQHILP